MICIADHTTIRRDADGQPPFRIVYCVYGKPRFIQEAQFSAITALRWLHPRDLADAVTIYTDNPDAFAPLGATVRPLDRDTVDAWQGEAGYTYRIKSCAVQAALNEFNVSTILLDSDTYLASDVSKLVDRVSPGSSLMHCAEGLIFERPEFAAFADQVRGAYPDKRFPMPGDREIAINEHELQMWNSGVIGVHPANRLLIDDAIAFMDETNRRLKAFFVEQFAFGVVLGASTRLVPSDDIVAHYWGETVDPYFGVGKREFIARQARPIVQTAVRDGVDAALDALAKSPIRPFRRPLHVRIARRLRRMLVGGAP